MVGEKEEKGNLKSGCPRELSFKLKRVALDGQQVASSQLPKNPALEGANPFYLERVFLLVIFAKKNLDKVSTLWYN